MPPGASGSTFHSFCVWVLRQDIHLGYSPRFAIYGTGDQRSLLKRIMVAERLSVGRGEVNGILRNIDRAKNQMVAPADYKSHFGASAGDATPRLYPLYQQHLKALSAVDFNDLINLTVRLWTHHPDVLARWQRRFPYLMVDEYQDTNQAQFKLVKLLGQRTRNVMVVGDDDRHLRLPGADIRNILDFEKSFPGAEVVRLEQNYRSTGNILKAASAVVAHNQGRMTKTLWTDRGDGDKLQAIVGDDEREQARLVVSRIRQLCRNGRRFRDIAVIYRTNAASRLVEEQLVRAEIPHVLVGSVKFYERKEVKDLLAYLRLVLNPADDEAVLRAINSPRRGIGAKSIEGLQQLAAERGVPLLEAAREWGAGRGRGRKGALGFVACIDRLRAAVEDTAPGKLVELAASESGYLEALANEGTDEAQSRMDNIDELARAVGRAVELDEPDAGAADEGPTAGPAEAALERLQRFLDQAALSGQADELPEADERGQVTLLTAHLAKGLEFPVVFVLNLPRGFPHFNAMNDEAELEEERRLIYVAFTRAEELLLLCRPRRRFNHSSRQFEDVPPSGSSGRSPSSAWRWDASPDGADRSARLQRLGFGTARSPAHGSAAGRRATATGGPSGRERQRMSTTSGSGTRVMHRSFGPDQPQATGAPHNLKVAVAFDSGVQKTLLARFANLEVVDE